jgi:PAS domain S-box-containing protein
MTARHTRSSMHFFRHAVGFGEGSALAAIVGSASDAVITKTVDGVVTAWNEGAHLLYGQPVEQMIGHNIEATIPLDGIDLERARHARVALGASESGYRCVRVRSDGQRIEVVMSMSPMRNAKGRVVGIASISRPASDKELADARFASLLEAAPDAIICVDHDGRIAMVNAQVGAVFGYPPEELLGSPFHALLPKSILVGQPRATANERLPPQSLGTDVGVPLFARRRNGSTFPVEVSLASSTDGTEEMVIVAVRDVSRQRATEAAVRENEARLRQLAEGVDILFILRQLEPAAYLYVSPGCRHVLGLAPEELMADPELTQTMVHPEDRERVDTDYTSVILAGRPATCQYRIVLPDGSLRWVRSSSTPVPEPGASSRAVITLENITDRMEIANALEEAEASARAANKAKSEFLSRMSHELRTPLVAVIGFGQLLDRRLPNSEYSAYIGHILNGGRHLLALINDVLDIAGIESGAMSVTLEEVQLSGLVEETVQLMQPLADAAGITVISTDLDAQLVAQADRQRLRQILLNLLSNAIKYNRPNGNVWIQALATGTGHVTLSVRDDGPGIAPEYLPRVFTEFDRLGAKASAIEGTGIGLALTRSLTELMGGRIAVTSDLGHGCTFTVTLSLATQLAHLEKPDW